MTLLQFTKPNTSSADRNLLWPVYSIRGFLPELDPMVAFSADSPYARLDEIGRDLPSLLLDKQFRKYARSLKIPSWQESNWTNRQSALHLYYLRVGFLASGYINQVGQETCNVLPANIAIPLVTVCRLLNRPAILSYDGYALYNWKRFNKKKAVQLGNIDTLQNFVHLYDEHWFILIHIEIEAIAADILEAISQIAIALQTSPDTDIDSFLWQISDALARQVKVLKRIPERMDPALYFKTFRPYIRFFEKVIYQGVDQRAIDFRGETGAQSSIIPTLIAFLKIPHQASILTKHLEDMKYYMPQHHQNLIASITVMPNIKRTEYKDSFNAILNNLIEFRRVHLEWANEYIHKHVQDPRGTGGTPYMHWLEQLIKETEAYKI